MYETMGFGFMGVFGWLIMMLFFGLFIWFIVWIINNTSLNNSTNNSLNSKNKTPLEIIKERYAKGEITKKEYEDMKKEL